MVSHIEYASLINKINDHNPFLSIIGILPNQLRILAKQTNNDGDKTFEEVSRKLFWNGYNIWKKRKRLISNFWKHIAPEEWKTHGKPNRKEYHVSRDCRNPFHFMDKHCDLTHTKPTPCICSRIIKQNKNYR